MVQQVIDVGASANDRTGDTWRDAFVKVNSNETELFDFKDSQSFVFIAEEANFPVQDSTTITLESNMVYVVSTTVITGKKFSCQDGSVITMFNTFGPALIYTGSGTMFTGVDASFTISAMTIVCAAAQAFSFTDSIGKLKVFTCNSVTVGSCLKLATFDNMIQTQFFTSFAACADGIELLDDQTLLTIERLALISTSASFIAIDIGSAVIDNIELADLAVNAPAGGIGISGVASSANVPAGQLATVRDCSFVGGMTTILQNITTDDVRWSFRDNTPIKDTQPDGLSSLDANATATVIAIIDTPVLVAGTWTCERESQFTCTTAGRFTYNGERALTSPIDVILTIDPVSDSTVTVYVALNGTIINNSGIQQFTKASDPGNVNTMWQIELVQNDFIEVFVENNSSTSNLVVTDAIFRVR